LDGKALVWEVATGRQVFALPPEHGFVWSVAWNADGTRLATGSQDGTIRVVEGLEQTPKVHAFKALNPLDGLPREWGVRAVAWSPRGDRVATNGADGAVVIWDPIRGVELSRTQRQQAWVTGVAWSPDGKQLASTHADLVVMTWNAETGALLSTMRGHNAWVEAVAWHPDGTRLASAAFDNSVRVWDPRTGDETFVLRGNFGAFHDVSWSPDGAQLAAACSDGQIWIWDATRGFERDTTARALPYIDRKVASGTARGEDLLWFAESYFRAGKPDQALGLMKALTEQTGNVALLAKLGTLYLAAGQAKEAIPCMVKASSFNPDDTGLSLKVATLQAWFGQEKEFADTRQRILAFAKNTQEWTTADRAAKACSISPGADKAELVAILAIARKGVELVNGGEGSEWALLARGMAEYRSGEYAAAHETLIVPAKVGPSNYAITGTAMLYQAMSLFQQGKKDEARKRSSEAASLIRPMPVDKQNPLAGDAGPDDLILWLANKEAKALIRFDSEPPASPSPKDKK
jgi:tetratricopeptide (TPR) repeat protein